MKLKNGIGCFEQRMAGYENVFAKAQSYITIANRLLNE